MDTNDDDFNLEEISILLYTVAHIGKELGSLAAEYANDRDVILEINEIEDSFKKLIFGEPTDSSDTSMLSIAEELEINRDLLN